MAFVSRICGVLFINSIYTILSKNSRKNSHDAVFLAMHPIMMS